MADKTLQSNEPSLAWRLMRRLNPLISRRLRSKRKFGPSVLVLVTTGRRTGKPHRTPLQYELINGLYYIASARGPEADWFCNILAEPNVRFELEGVTYNAKAETITDPVQIADFLELRLDRNPRMIGLMLRLEGISRDFTRTELEEFSRQKALVILHPRGEILD